MSLGKAQPSLRQDMLRVEGLEVAVTRRVKEHDKGHHFRAAQSIVTVALARHGCAGAAGRTTAVASKLVQRTGKSRLCHRKQVKSPSENSFRRDACFGELHLYRIGFSFQFLSRTHVNPMFEEAQHTFTSEKRVCIRQSFFLRISRAGLL